ncbi:MAG: helix-turn-helix transcriptional regulator [Bacteroidales bacterium]|nr:helix-turn-helix transcriptional regulator [Bacteroidales bacterium]
MNTVPAEVVKHKVSSDLKERKLSQIEIAEKTGLARQTVASILASDDYFSKKHAVLFSLAFGYNRDFLRKGEGRMLSEESDYGKEIKIEYQDRLIDILRRATDVSSMVNALVLRDGRESCLDLLRRVQIMNNFVSAVKYFPQLYVNRDENPPHNTELMDAAVKLFTPVYDELIQIMRDRYGLDAEVHF